MHDSDCPLSVSFLKWNQGKAENRTESDPEDVFNVDDRYIGLAWKMNLKWDIKTDNRSQKYYAPIIENNSTDIGDKLYYDYMYIDLFYPRGNESFRNNFTQKFRTEGFEAHTWLQVPEWNIGNLVEFYVTVEGGEDIPLKWKTNNYDRYQTNKTGKPDFNFTFDTSQKLNLEVNKEIKMVIKNHFMYKKELHIHEIFLKGEDLRWKIVGGVSTTIPKEPIVKPEPPAPAETVAKQNSLAQAAGKAATAVALFIVKYFVIVDIMINFMGKINITLSPLLGDYVENIKKAELPSIGFMEVTSPINDGGGKMKEDYTD